MTRALTFAIVAIVVAVAACANGTGAVHPRAASIERGYGDAGDANPAAPEATGSRPTVATIEVDTIEGPAQIGNGNTQNNYFHGPPQRTLSDGALNALVAALIGKSPEKFRVVAYTNSREELALAEQICSALLRAGWTHARSDLEGDIVARSAGCATRSLGDFDYEGVRLVFSMPSPAWAALVQWFQSESGLVKISGGHWSDRPPSVDENVRIIVGPAPIQGDGSP